MYARPRDKLMSEKGIWLPVTFCAKPPLIHLPLVVAFCKQSSSEAIDRALAPPTAAKSVIALNNLQIPPVC